MKEVSDEPPRMIVDPLAAEGYLTLLPGKRGSYKSFLTLALAACCHQGGGELAGLRCEHVNALLVDAENGPRLLKQRELACGIDPARGLLVADGTRIKLPRDMRLLHELVEETSAQFVILDALRRLTPGLDEDSSRDMAPVIAGIAQIARDLQAAIVLLHHQSSKPNAPPSRGSSAIEDQVDAVMRLKRYPDGKLKLWTGQDPKYRWAEEPDPVWVNFGHAGGVFALGECDPATGDEEEDPGPTAREIVSAALLSYMRGEGAKVQAQPLIGEVAPCTPSWTGADLARGIGREAKDGTVRNALVALERAGQVTRGVDKRWLLPDVERPAPRSAIYGPEEQR
jgi:hypothetical protein